MKFKAAERSVFGSKFIDSLEREGIEQQIRRAKWLVWHGKAGKVTLPRFDVHQAKQP
jgi:HD superfamily phosphohydrolase YqeK